MGIHRKTVAYRTDDETRFQHERIRMAFPWLLDDHTSVIKFCARVVFALLFTPVTVQNVQDLLQGLRCMTLQSETDARQYSLPFRPEGASLRLRMRMGA